MVGEGRPSHHQRGARRIRTIGRASAPQTTRKLLASHSEVPPPDITSSPLRACPCVWLPGKRTDVGTTRSRLMAAAELRHDAPAGRRRRTICRQIGQLLRPVGLCSRDIAQRIRAIPALRLWRTVRCGRMCTPFPIRPAWLSPSAPRRCESTRRVCHPGPPEPPSPEGARCIGSGMPTSRSSSPTCGRASCSPCRRSVRCCRGAVRRRGSPRWVA
jgi:hypothetical protein